VRGTSARQDVGTSLASAAQVVFISNDDAPRVDLCHRPPRVWFITRTSAFSFVVYCFMDYSDVMASKVTKRVVTQPRKIFITRHGERVDFIDKTWKHTAQRYNPFRMTG
jgi:hypothetical protein